VIVRKTLIFCGDKTSSPRAVSLRESCGVMKQSSSRTAEANVTLNSLVQNPRFLIASWRPLN
jgi:hypothetical protein